MATDRSPTTQGRAAVIGDVHLQVTQLRQLLAGPLHDAKVVVQLGDLLDRGAGDPIEAIDTLNKHRAVWLAGNHELAYLGGPVYRGMREPAGRAVAQQLRSLVIDGHLRAAVAVEGVLCVHGGVSRAYWQTHLKESCGTDVTLIAAELNRRLVMAVARSDFSHPQFAALEADIRGPFWASLTTDILAEGLPPFDQAVGHSKVDEVAWFSSSDGSPQRVLATCLPEGAGTGPGWAWLN